MNQKFTIGDLANEAGISAKAIRLYEKKGLMKPVAYSEGKYRLYDNNARIVLQKIMTLKYIGFSLDEIGTLLEKDKDNDIHKSLSFQKQLLEIKRNKIDKVLYCVDQAAKRCAGGEIDWNSFTDIMRAVIIDRNADEGYWAALKYGINDEWYAHIYKNIAIRPDERILDIGCGYGLLWRINWNSIPSNVILTLMDLRGTWADDFAAFVGENVHTLKEGTRFEFVWEDIEREASITGKYNRIIANYLFVFLKDPLRLMHRINDALAEGGSFYCIIGGNTFSLEKVAALLSSFDSTYDTVNEKINQIRLKQEEFHNQLCSVFQSVDWVTLNSGLAFKNTNEFLEYYMKKDLIAAYDLNKGKEALEDYLSQLIEKDGRIVIPSETRLYCCR